MINFLNQELDQIVTLLITMKINHLIMVHLYYGQIIISSEFFIVIIIQKP
jgi:hypothetical protein